MKLSENIQAILKGMRKDMFPREGERVVVGWGNNSILFDYFFKDEWWVYDRSTMPHTVIEDETVLITRLMEGYKAEILGQYKWEKESV